MHLIQLTTLLPAQAMTILSCLLLCSWQPATVKMPQTWEPLTCGGKTHTQLWKGQANPLHYRWGNRSTELRHDTCQTTEPGLQTCELRFVPMRFLLLPRLPSTLSLSYISLLETKQSFREHRTVRLTLPAILVLPAPWKRLMGNVTLIPSKDR